MKYSLLLRGIFLHFKNYRNYTYFKSNQKSKVTNLFSFSKNVLLLLLLYFLFFQSINKRFIPKFQNINFWHVINHKKNFFGKRKTRGTSFNRSFWWYVVLGTCTLYRVSTKYLDKITDRFVRYYYPGTYLVSTLYCLNILNIWNMGDTRSNIPTNLQFFGIPQITVDNHVETLHAIVLGSKTKTGPKMSSSST